MNNGVPFPYQNSNSTSYFTNLHRWLMKLKQLQDKYDQLHETRFGEERERYSEIENEPEIELAAPVESPIKSIADGMDSVFLRGLTAECEERNT